MLPPPQPGKLLSIFRFVRFLFFSALFLMQIYKATNHIVSINIPLSLPHMDLWMIGLLFVVVVFLFPFGTFSLLPDARKKKKTCINLPARQFCICCEQHLLCCLVGGDKQPFTSSCSAFWEERAATAQPLFFFFIPANGDLNGLIHVGVWRGFCCGFVFVFYFYPNLSIVHRFLADSRLQER